MVWDQTRSLVLLLIIHGVSCRDLFNANCRSEICPCGESVTITCDLNDKLVNIKVQNEDTEETFLQSDFFTKKKPEDGKISIEWTDVKVMVTISEVTFSDIHKYVLHLSADSGFQTQYIDFKVSGMCEPKISEILETKELVCEVESESNSSIIWRNDHRYVYKMNKTTKKLTQGYKLRSTLKLTEEIEMEDNKLCCAASDGLYKEKEVCFPKTSAILSPLNSKNSTVSIVAIFVVVALVAAGVGYLMKRRNRIILREVLQEGNTPIPPLLQPQTV
ncbi:uncharacterized protein LOC143766099 isoform X2 [Ranitomeya variabilis]|uniref:uncharacterized protein LOC143766099 isoform X2 n=1 Tax=Ranitomeya variabilis TaxID=490064 RepID=UPI004057A10E